MSAPSLPASLGSVEIASLISSALYGVMLGQYYTYYKAGFNDRWLVKGLVCIRLRSEWIMHSYSELAGHFRIVSQSISMYRSGYAHNRSLLAASSRALTSWFSGSFYTCLQSLISATRPVSSNELLLTQYKR